MTEALHTELNKNLKYAGLFRRLFAIFYDCFLLLAILFIATAIAFVLNHGKAIETDDTFRPLFALILLFLIYLYFTWFWIHGGQSLGMKTWKIKLVSNEANIISWKTAGIRFISALFSWGCFGIGFLWALIDKKNRCWHDMISKTQLIDLRD